MDSSSASICQEEATHQLNLFSKKAEFPAAPAAAEAYDWNPQAYLATNSLMALNGALVGEKLLADVSGTASRDSKTHHPSLNTSKRAFDVTFAGLALFFLLPVLIGCALAISIESRGPVFFRQRRVGKGRKTFQIIKFRTMVPDAEQVLADFLVASPAAQKEWSADRKLRRDPRVTTVGSFMRKLSLDELPQFWNVLVGDMSVVGPRPIVQAEIPRYGEAFTAYTAVRPGLTGLWQVSGRNDTGYSTRIALDRHYVHSWSPTLDSRIILKTISTVLRSAGAY